MHEYTKLDFNGIIETEKHSNYCTYQNSESQGF